MKKIIFFDFSCAARSILLLAVVVALSAAGQERVSMFTVDAGFASIHDSYLTPITYNGVDFSVVFGKLVL